jgi:hypothetical protein
VPPLGTEVATGADYNDSVQWDEIAQALIARPGGTTIMLSKDSPVDYLAYNVCFCLFVCLFVLLVESGGSCFFLLFVMTTTCLYVYFVRGDFRFFGFRFWFFFGWW